MSLSELFFANTEHIPIIKLTQTGLGHFIGHTENALDTFSYNSIQILSTVKMVILLSNSGPEY